MITKEKLKADYKRKRSETQQRKDREIEQYFNTHKTINIQIAQNYHVKRTYQDQGEEK